MEEENLRLCIKPACSGHLCLIQLECKCTGTTITNNKMKAEISTNSLPSVAAISLCRGPVTLWSIIKTRSHRSGSLCMVPQSSISISQGPSWKCKFPGPTLNLLNQTLWQWGPEIYPSGEPAAH